MQKIALIVVGISLVVAALVLFWHYRTADVVPATVAVVEDMSLGKPLSHWLVELKSDSVPSRCRAVRAIGLSHGSASAIPALIEALRDEASEVRITAIDSLLAVGPKAGAAAPDLIARLEDSDVAVRAKAAAALGLMKNSDPQIMGALSERLTDEASQVRTTAAESLRKLDPRSQDALPVLMALLDGEDQAARALAGHALFGYGADAKVALPQLIEALQAEEVDVRIGAAKGISGVGREAGPAVDGLVQAAQNAVNADELLAVAGALAAIGPDAKVAVPLLRELSNKFPVPNFDRMMRMSIESIESSQ